MAPLMSASGVTGASVAVYCVGPLVAAAVFVRGLRVPILSPLLRATRLFGALAALSFALERIAGTPGRFALACAASGIAAAVCACVAETELAGTILRQFRATKPRAQEARALH
jgi:hypothetical protein